MKLNDRDVVLWVGFGGRLTQERVSTVEGKPGIFYPDVNEDEAANRCDFVAAAVNDPAIVAQARRIARRQSLDLVDR